MTQLAISTYYSFINPIQTWNLQLQTTSWATAVGVALNSSGATQQAIIASS